MLPDKLASTIAAVEEMRAATCTTPRLAARVRGRVLHYGVAVPFIAVAAASLSQLMHKREAGLGPLEDIPHMRDEPSLQFDWEESIEISASAGPWTLWPGRCGKRAQQASPSGQSS